MKPVPSALMLALVLATGLPRLHAQETPVAAPEMNAIAEDIGQPFATRHAVFEPRAYAALPGWGTDDFSGAVDGMRQTCAALRGRAVWQGLCADFGAASTGGPDALRAFFERHFYAYQVMSPERVSSGKLTGYFEPLLDGSRTRDDRFRYPVYGQPGDLRLLDASAAGAPVAWLYTDGIRLRQGAPGDNRSQEYQIDLDGMAAGVRDKRYRVRVDGRRVVPYYSRQQIEKAAIQAPVLAWVDNPHKLYSMQVQGSGKIRLREGGLIRLAYAEQNGHPFRPRVTRGIGADLALAEIKSRGLVAGSSAGAPKALAPDPALPAGVNDEVARMIAALSGKAPPRQSRPARPAQATRPATASNPRPAASPSTTPPPGASSSNQSEVDAMVAALSGNASASTPRPASPATASRPATAAAAAPVQAAPRPQATPARPHAAGGASNNEINAIIAALKGQAPPPAPRPVGTPAGGNPVSSASVASASSVSYGGGSAGAAPSPHAGGTTGIPDPSFVFFRSIGDGPEGPVGALGVPLTAGRSLAVDPRTTPLGAPVFISTTEPGGSEPMHRLMFAQDTGGAIRGSVRGDFFWGFGDTAGRMALATNDQMEMWLLLPRQQPISAVANKGMRLRGAARQQLPDCVIADPDFCVEDDTID